MKQLTAAFSLLFLIISATTLASSFNARFAFLDKNMDGHISIAEAKKDKHVMKQFRDLDVDNDDMISKQEFAAFKP
jgi:Ca2+-binding EF-hand superfamily protein